MIHLTKSTYLKNVKELNGRTFFKRIIHLRTNIFSLNRQNVKMKFQI